jgi:hypothetical protein
MAPAATVGRNSGDFGHGRSREVGEKKEEREGFDSIPHLPRGCIVDIEFDSRRGGGCLFHFWAAVLFMPALDRGGRQGEGRGTVQGGPRWRRRRRSGAQAQELGLAAAVSGGGALQVICSWAAQGGMQGWAGAVQEEGGAATGVRARQEEREGAGATLEGRRSRGGGASVL